MDLIPAIGFRKRYSWKEVCAFLGMTRPQVEWIVFGRELLRKRYEGTYPFAQSDLNQFITRFNNGEYDLGVRKPKRTTAEKVFGILNDVKV